MLVYCISAGNMSSYLVETNCCICSYISGSELLDFLFDYLIRFLDYFFFVTGGICYFSLN